MSEAFDVHMVCVLDRPNITPSFIKMRLAEPTTVTNFEILKPPCGVTADLVISPFFQFSHCFG